MEYLELRIKVDKADLEKTEGLLIASDYSSMMIDDPDDVRDIIEHPDVYRYDYLNEALTEDLFRRPVITLFFTDDEEGRAELEAARRLLESSATGTDGSDILIECENAGDDSEWLYRWQEYFKPVRVGSRIVVRPSWEEYAPELGDLVIEMDPGMAFGSGLHETTSMCIRALEEYVGKVRPCDEDGKDRLVRILDVGTGTGILAIAGVLLGADEALGIDIDADAVGVAEENIEKNGLGGRIRVQQGDLTAGIDYRADIITANLMADLVMKLSPAAFGHLRSGGIYISSGILDIKEDIVAEAIRSAGFTVEDVLHDGEWCAIIAVKE